jgi:alpha-L-fucosidase
MASSIVPPLTRSATDSKPAPAPASLPLTAAPAGHWFDSAACGMFFHWGPYSVAARGEWVMNRECIPAAEYQERYINPWKAESFDPDEWMNLVVRMGADYIVFTTRHHDGFALWRSAVNPHNSTRLGPRRDIVAEVVAAARRAGLRIGFYYSIANWIHPDYPEPFARDWPLDKDWTSPAHRERFQAYVTAELRELLTGYGRVDYLWFDGQEPASIRNPRWNALARELQPGILINNRNGPDGDVVICEQSLRTTLPTGRWEACFTLNQNWGYHARDLAYKHESELLALLIKVNGGGGKLLLNIGPRGDGSVPEESIHVITTCGEWIRDHRALLLDSDNQSFSWNNSALASRRDRSVILYFMHGLPAEFCWSETRTRLRSARHLPSGRLVDFSQQGERIHLYRLREQAATGLFPAVELLFDETPLPIQEQKTFWIPG